MNGASDSSHERIAVGSGTFVCAIAYAGAESESLFLGVEHFGFGEVKHIIGVKNSLKPSLSSSTRKFIARGSVIT